MHLVGYFHKHITMHGFMNVKLVVYCLKSVWHITETPRRVFVLLLNNILLSFKSRHFIKYTKITTNTYKRYLSSYVWIQQHKLQYLHTYSHMHIYIYIYIYIHTHTHTHTHTHPQTHQFSTERTSMPCQESVLSCLLNFRLSSGCFHTQC